MENGLFEGSSDGRRNGDAQCDGLTRGNVVFGGSVEINSAGRDI